MQQKSPRDRNLAMISVLLRRRRRRRRCRRRCRRRRRRMRSHQSRQCKVEPERTKSFEIAYLTGSATQVCQASTFLSFSIISHGKL